MVCFIRNCSQKRASFSFYLLARAGCFDFKFLTFFCLNKYNSTTLNEKLISFRILNRIDSVHSFGSSQFILNQSV
jgi:hypothetical protein